MPTVPQLAEVINEAADVACAYHFASDEHNRQPGPRHLPLDLTLQWIQLGGTCQTYAPAALDLSRACKGGGNKIPWVVPVMLQTHSW